MSNPRPLSDLVPKLTKDILGKKSPDFGKMLLAWPNIVGAEMASKTMPLDLKFPRTAGGKKGPATLHLAVQSACALEISYQKSLLIEKLNGFLGCAAIKDIKIVQQTNIMTGKTTSSPPLRPLTLQETQLLDEILAGTQENDLQTALKNLGKAIISRQIKDYE